MSFTVKHQPVSEEKEKRLFEFINKMEKSKNVVKGVNEATKCLNRGLAKLVVIAIDAEPPELTFSLPIICEDKGVKYVHVSSKMSLGKACNILRPVIAACIYCPKDKESLRIDDRIREML